MSDRPMRLKYLTKMKIILCIFLLCITAVSVFGKPQELNGIVGESVKFPAAVKIQGTLRYSGVPIGNVTSGRFTAAYSEKFSGRVQWDSSTGLFSLSELRLKDSGIYTVQDTQQTSVSTFSLTVWEDNVPVSKPHLSVTRNEYRCTVLCAAARGTGVTLTLYKNGEKNPYVSSFVESAPHLHLPVPVDEGGIYTCEAKNSVSRNTSEPLTVGAHCTAPAGPSTGTIVAIVMAAVAILIAVVLAVLYCHIRSKRRDIRSKHRDAVRTLLQDIESMHQDIGSGNPAVRKLILDVKTLLDTLVHLAPGDEGWTLFPADTGSKSKDTGSKSKVEDEQALIHNAVRTLLQDIESMHPDIRSRNPAVRKLILDVKTLLDTLVQLAPVEDAQALIHNVEDAQALIHNAVGPIILDIRSMHPDIGSGNPAVRKLILDVKTLLDTLVQLAPDVKTLLDTLVQLAPEQLQAIPPDDTGSKSKGFDMSDRSDELEDEPPQTQTYIISPDSLMTYKSL